MRAIVDIDWFTITGQIILTTESTKEVENKLVKARTQTLEFFIMDFFLFLRNSISSEHKSFFLILCDVKDKTQ